uniref:ribonuclease H n=1 Tax=Leptobrachium leishanense TaxID=445787 RepID=A0A8C5PU31_9ANUR
MICPMELEALICPVERKPCAPIILGTNARIVQDMFRTYLSEVGDVSLARLMEVSPVLGKECRRLALQAKPGSCYYSGKESVFLKPGETKTLRAIASMHHEISGGTRQYLVESLTEEDTKNGWTLIPEVKDWRNHWCKDFPVMIQNFTPTEVRIDRHQKIGVIHLIEQVSSVMSMKAELGSNLEGCIDFDLEDSPLPQEWKDRLRSKLITREEVFSREELDVGCARSATHAIRLSNSTPFRERSRRIPPRDVEDVRDILQRMEESGIIKESRSPYASPIVIVRKKNGTVRLCIDYRTLNKRTVPDQYTLPRIEDLLNALSGSQWFSVLDLRSGYYQVPLNEEDQEKTAFICPLGFYEFTRMPQGITGAPATFQRLMEKTVGDMNPKECLVYLDDLIVFGRTPEEHEQRLLKVLDRLQAEGLKLSLDKCRFARDSVTYIGHIVSAEGVATDPAKIEAVVNWPRPDTISELRSFLGFCGYYRRFVKDYSKIARELHNLLKVTSVIEGAKVPSPKDSFGNKWTSGCEEAFLTLKERLTEAPVLAYADPEKQYVLHVDASMEALGGVLHQSYPEGLRPVAYISRSLTGAEKNYPVHKLEFLALKWAIVDKLHDYLYGTTFEVRTDNNPLTYIQTTAKLDATGHRWLAALSSYNFSLKYKPGPKNVSADALSRRPGLLPHEEKEEWEEIPGPGVGAFCHTYVVAEKQEEFSDLRGIDSISYSSEAVPEIFCAPVILQHWSQITNEEKKKAQSQDWYIGTVLKAMRVKNPKLLSSLPIGQRDVYR